MLSGRRVGARTQGRALALYVISIMDCLSGWRTNMTEQALFSQQYLALRVFFFNGFPHSGQLTIFKFPLG
jgi:hypothetical protein